MAIERAKSDESKNQITWTQVPNSPFYTAVIFKAAYRLPIKYYFASILKSQVFPNVLQFAPFQDHFSD